MAMILGASPASIAHAAKVLREEGLVAFPTETVYGLGALATSDAAIARVYNVKGRPANNPLIVHCIDMDAADRIAVFSEQADVLAQTFWPGPLTLVLPRRANCGLSTRLSPGMETVALRIPSHEIAQALLKAVALPIAAPSANPSGRLSPTTAKHVDSMLGDRIDMILAGGRCSVGLESTVVDLSGAEPRLLRPGAVLRDEIEAMIGPLPSPTPRVPEHSDERTPLHSPGLLRSHYAPNASVRLNAVDVQPGEVLIAFGPDLRKGDDVINLSEKGDLNEAAANLFSALHEADRPDIIGIAVAPIPEDGVGSAINDRLRRAAAPRDDRK